MKNYKYYLIVIVLIMTIPVIYKATLKERKTEYKRDNYTIYEHFYIKNNKHYYDYKISNKKEEYSFTINKNNHKKQKLIKNIKTYKEGNITCIITIYKTNINKEIYCLKDNLQVSKYVLKDDDNYKNILSKANTYSILNTEESNYNTTFRNINIYNKNIPDSYKIIIWTYKGIVIISNKEPIYKRFQ